MRLHLNSSVSNTPDTAPATQTGGVSARGPARAGSSSGSGDTTSVSGASAALNAESAQRSARIQQLSATVQGGEYRVSSAAVSTAIVGQAASSRG